MKRVLLTIALAALCAGCAEQTLQEQAASPNAAPEAGVSEMAVAATPSSEGEMQMVAVEVPTMHCPIACWPKVQKTLASQPNVREVKLADQKEEGLIDKPVVYVSYEGDFNSDAAFSALSAAGFDGAKVEAKE
jgi:hypothetical protein